MNKEEIKFIAHSKQWQQSFEFTLDDVRNDLSDTGHSIPYIIVTIEGRPFKQRALLSECDIKPLYSTPPPSEASREEIELPENATGGHKTKDNIIHKHLVKTVNDSFHGRRMTELMKIYNEKIDNVDRSLLSQIIFNAMDEHAVKYASQFPTANVTQPTNKKIESFNSIDLSTPEGMYLFNAIAVITGKYETSMSPDTVLSHLSVFPNTDWPKPSNVTQGEVERIKEEPTWTNNKLSLEEIKQYFSYRATRDINGTPLMEKTNGIDKLMSFTDFKLALADMSYRFEVDSTELTQLRTTIDDQAKKIERLNIEANEIPHSVNQFLGDYKSIEDYLMRRNPEEEA